MKKYQRFIPLLCAAAFVLSSCGAAGDSSTEAASTENKEEVTISYSLWGDENRQAYTMEQIEAFEEAYPYIKVNVDYSTWDQTNAKIDNIMATGAEADVMQINYNWLSKYSADGNGYYDLNQVSDIISLDAFSDLTLSNGTINGKLNALTIAVNTSVQVYNKTMYDYYGLELPESIEDLYADAEIMKGDNVYQLGMQDNQLILFLCGYYENASGNSVLDGTGMLSLDEEAWTYIAQTYKSLMDNCIICPRSEFSDTSIEGNRVSGVVCWLNSIQKYEDIITDAGNEPAVGRFLWTDITERMGNYYKPSTMLAISAHTEHPTEAAMLLEFLMNDETAVNLQGVEKGVPDSRIAQQYLMEAGSLNNDIFYSTLRLDFYMEYMHKVPKILEEEDIYESILDNLDAYVYGSKSLEETVQILKEIK